MVALATTGYSAVRALRVLLAPRILLLSYWPWKYGEQQQHYEHSVSESRGMSEDL